MKEYPILFKPEMVRAILDGRKTQTRRVVKCIHEIESLATANDWNIGRADGRMVPYEKWGPKRGLHLFRAESGTVFAIPCPYGVPGDRLWVRETWVYIDNSEFDAKSYIEYRADTNNPYPGEWPEDEAKGNPEAPKWKPSIFMPKKYCRLWLEVTNVRVERVQEITENACVAEGLKLLQGGIKSEFRLIWNTMHGKKHPWSSNPWVWVIEFKIAKQI